MKALRRRKLEDERAKMQKRIDDELRIRSGSGMGQAMTGSPEAARAAGSEDRSPPADGKQSMKVVKTNRFGRKQTRMLELDFNNGCIVNKDKEGKILKDHHASGVMFCEPHGLLGLTIFLPNKKEYKLNFNTQEERQIFQKNLVDLCASTTRMNHPTESKQFDVDAVDTSQEQLQYTFRFKYSKNVDVSLVDTIVHIDINGISLCKPPDEASSSGQVELTVDAFYKFNVVKSWTYEGDYVVLELKSKTGLDDKYKFKASTEEYACELVEAIQICLSAAAQKMKREKAARKAAKAAKAANAGTKTAGKSVEPSAEAAKEKLKERKRRASVVVDMAAMAESMSIGGASSKPSSSVIDSMMGASGSPQSQRAMMAAACAAAGMDFGGDGYVEDEVDDAVPSGMALDIVGVMAEMQAEPAKEGREAVLQERRRSVIADLSGTDATVSAERAQRAGLLKDLAHFVDMAESGMSQIVEGDEEEEEEEEEEEDEDEEAAAGMAEEIDSGEHRPPPMAMRTRRGGRSPTATLADSEPQSKPATTEVDSAHPEPETGLRSSSSAAEALAGAAVVAAEEEEDEKEMDV